MATEFLVPVQSSWYWKCGCCGNKWNRFLEPAIHAASMPGLAGKGSWSALRSLELRFQQVLAGNNM
jgi:hypothetical protein